MTEITNSIMVSANPTINVESAVKILSHQVRKKALLQVENDTFRVVK